MSPRRGRNGLAPEWGLAAPEGLVDLELHVAGAEAQITDRAAVEGGKLAALAGATAPARQDLVECGVGAGQRRLEL